MAAVPAEDALPARVASGAQAPGRGAWEPCCRLRIASLISRTAMVSM